MGIVKLKSSFRRIENTEMDIFLATSNLVDCEHQTNCMIYTWENNSNFSKLLLNLIQARILEICYLSLIYMTEFMYDAKRRVS
jgi:hypothetical protein